MRFTTALGLVPVLLVTYACSAPSAEEMGSKSAAVSAGCTASREEILASTSAARQNAIQRGFRWLDNNVPYSQSASYEGYRTDCSGFVSMCWELGTSTDTGALYATGTYDSDLGSWDDLLPADALVHRSGGKGHVVLFLGWEPDKSGACVLEQASTASDMQFRVRSLASLKSGGFKPIRATVLADDTGAASGETAAPAADTSTRDPAASDPAAPADPSTPADPTPPDPGAADAGTCGSSFADLDVCNAALLTRGIECGVVTDACGNTVNCDAVAGFGCKAPRTCSSAQKCVSHGAKTPASTTEPPAPSGTVPPVGDPGDDVTPPTAKGDDSSKTPGKSTAAAAKGAEPSASSGCSASPSKRTGNAGGDALPIVALAVAACIARRRPRGDARGA